MIDATSPAFSFIVPAICFAVVMAYGFYDLKARQPVQEGEQQAVLAHA